MRPADPVVEWPQDEPPSSVVDGRYFLTSRRTGILDCSDKGGGSRLSLDIGAARAARAIAYRRSREGGALAFRYLALFKPYGVLSQFTDRQGRATLASLVPVEGVYPVGRLDRDSEGLLLLTDDGALAHRLTDPRFEHAKMYVVQVERVPDERSLEQLRSGVALKDGRTRPAQVTLVPQPPPFPERAVPIRFRKSVPTAWLQLTIFEGRNRQVRRMTAAVGHPALRLVRVGIGPIALGGLAPGDWRELTAAEVDLVRSVRNEPDRGRRRQRSRLGR